MLILLIVGILGIICTFWHLIKAGVNYEEKRERWEKPYEDTDSYIFHFYPILFFAVCALMGGLGLLAGMPLLW